MLFSHPPRCHFRQLWTQKWQKAAAPLTIKPRAEPLIVPVQRGNYLHPRPTLGTGRWGKKRRQGEEGQEGMCGWTKWQDGWQGVGRFWHSHLREWAAGWEVSLIHSFSESQRLETETGSWLKSGCRVWILNVVCRLVLCRFVHVFVF